MSPGSRTPDRFPPKSRALRVPLRPPSVCRAWVRVAAVCAPERAPLTPLHLLCLGVSADSTRGFAAARVQEGERARRAPGKREEVAPGVRAGPVVSRPGRWELSCGINCLFVSGWEVDPPPPPPPAPLRRPVAPAPARASGSPLSETAGCAASGLWIRPKPGVRVGGRGHPAARDAGAPCWSPRPRRRQAPERPRATRPGQRGAPRKTVVLVETPAAARSPARRETLTQIPPAPRLS